MKDNELVLLTLPQLRAELPKWNLTKLAYRTETSRQTLSAIASGSQTNPSYKVLSRLCEYIADNTPGTEYATIPPYNFKCEAKDV